MGFEPTTSTLARLRSTPELRPHPGPARILAGKRAHHSHRAALCKSQLWIDISLFSFLEIGRTAVYGAAHHDRY